MGLEEQSRSLGPDDYRRRYQTLKDNAAKTAQNALAPTRGANSVALPAELIVHEETIAGGWYWTRHIARGQTIRIYNSDVGGGVSALFWNARDTSERLNVADTVKVQWTARITSGRILLSDMGRVMVSITDDACGYHDCILGGSTPDDDAGQDGPDSPRGRNSQTNFILAAGKLGMDIRDIGPCMTFFAPVVTDEVGRFVWRDDLVKPGMYVDLRAEMDLIVALSNCPHPLSSVAATQVSPVKAVVLRSPPPGAHDICKSGAEEAGRAFENTETMLKTAGAL
jgi:urea carboxylase-associated protein 2